MRQTLFFIPDQIVGFPLLGFGLLLILWLVGSSIFLIYLLKTQGWTAETMSFLPFVGIVAVALGIVLPMVATPQGLPIRGYGVFLLIATVSGVLLAVHRAHRVGLAADVIFSLAFHMFVGGILGARLFYIIQYWENIYDRGSLVRTIGNIVNFVEGGLVVYGSLVGALLAAVWFLQKQKLPMLPIADLVSPSLALGLAIGRIGCLMNGCCYGGECGHPWAISFPADSPPYYDQHRNGSFYGFRLGIDQAGHPVVAAVEAGGPAEAVGVPLGGVIEQIAANSTPTLEDAQLALGLSRDQVHLVVNGKLFSYSIGELPIRTRPIHPTQIYSSINAGLLCLLTLAYFPFRRRDGEVFGLLIAAYAVTRFLLEAIRTDEVGLWSTGMTISQNVSLLMLIGVGVLGVYVSRQPRGSFWPTPESATRPSLT